MNDSNRAELSDDDLVARLVSLSLETSRLKAEIVVYLIEVEERRHSSANGMQVDVRLLHQPVDDEHERRFSTDRSGGARPQASMPAALDRPRRASSLYARPPEESSDGRECQGAGRRDPRKVVPRRGAPPRCPGAAT